jgi:hypothetical protein
MLHTLHTSWSTNSTHCLRRTLPHAPAPAPAHALPLALQQAPAPAHAHALPYAHADAEAEGEAETDADAEAGTREAEAREGVVLTRAQRVCRVLRSAVCRGGSCAHRPAEESTGAREPSSTAPCPCTHTAGVCGEGEGEGERDGEEEGEREGEGERDGEEEGEREARCAQRQARVSAQASTAGAAVCRESASANSSHRPRRERAE